MTDKQYKNLMFAMSMVIAAISENRKTPNGYKLRGGLDFMSQLYANEKDGAKEVYDFLTSNSFDDYETRKQTIQEELLKRHRQKIQKNLDDFHKKQSEQLERERIGEVKNAAKFVV